MDTHVVWEGRGKEQHSVRQPKPRLPCDKDFGFPYEPLHTHTHGSTVLDSYVTYSHSCPHVMDAG
jgi:hypothetical protein